MLLKSGVSSSTHHSKVNRNTLSRTSKIQPKPKPNIFIRSVKVVFGLLVRAFVFVRMMDTDNPKL